MYEELLRLPEIRIILVYSDPQSKLQRLRFSKKFFLWRYDIFDCNSIYELSTRKEAS